jgi:hypothetical protein
LSDGFSGDLSFEVDSPHVAELNLRVRVEAVVAAVEGVAVVARPSVQHV